MLAIVNYSKNVSNCQICKPMETKEASKWVSINEACEILGITRPSIYRLVKNGILPAYRIKGVRGMKFKREDVLALIERVKPDEVEEEARKA